MEKDTDKLVEKKWSKKYKKSIDCSNPKGFSQKAHCAGRKKRESKMSLKLEELVGKKLTEEQFDEAAGKKDACYHKVKARYDVWPSAYASGALVKCRKVGAKNWGNKSKKESVNILGVKKLNEGKFRVFFDLDGGTPQTNLGRMSVEVTAKDKKEAEKLVASKFVGGMKLIRKNMTKKLKEGLNEAKYTHKYPSITAMAKDYKRIFPSTGPAGGVKIISGSKREATGKRSQPAFIKIEGDKKLIDAYKKIAFNGRGNYSDVIKSLKEESLKEFGLSPMDKALKQKLKDPKSGKEVTVGSIKNQGTKRYSSSLVKKANAIFKKAMEKEMATKKKIRKMQGEGIVNEKRGTCWVGYKQLGMKKKGDRMVPNCVKEIYYEENGKGYGYTFEFGAIEEAEYQGRKVKLNKIMQGDKKKFKVYVKNPKGNVVKVNFGQGGDAKGGTMRIRKSNPEARKSFRARHNCDNPGPKH